MNFFVLQWNKLRSWLRRDAAPALNRELERHRERAVEAVNAAFDDALAAGDATVDLFRSRLTEALAKKLLERGVPPAFVGLLAGLAAGYVLSLAPGERLRDAAERFRTYLVDRARNARF